MLEDAADLLGGEAGVDRHEDGMGERHAEVGVQHRRDVRQQVGDPVAGFDARSLEGAGETGDVGRHHGVGGALVAVDDRSAIGVDVGRPLQEHQRRELSAVDRPAAHVHCGSRLSRKALMPS